MINCLRVIGQQLTVITSDIRVNSVAQLTPKEVNIATSPLGKNAHLDPG
jgi:hypothetical protein